jgi:hypothetical protein
MITIGFSTRFDNQKYIDYLKKTSGHPKVQIIQKINNGEKSLSKVYNEILEESENNIVVFCHDDLEFDTNNWASKLGKIFEKNSDYGILGIAGTKYLPSSGQWWQVPQTMYGTVNHKHEGKKWTNQYSKPIQKIDDVVIVDGYYLIAILFNMNVCTVISYMYSCSNCPEVGMSRAFLPMVSNSMSVL